MIPDTIYALSSGRPPAAVSVVRISGPGAQAALAHLTHSPPPPRIARLRTLRTPSGDVLDRALVLFFPAPRSATGEDIVELQIHGGRAVVESVLSALSEQPGLRPAVAGEFTRRAFENGLIDLAESEGLADLLLAETQSQRRAALQLATGALSRLIEGWQRRLLTVSAMVEADLDFADEEDASASNSADLLVSIEELAAEMKSHLESVPAERLRDGVRVVIGGPPNAGKSTLLNHLVGRQAAITSPVAGTTRDMIEVPVAIEGVPFLFIDTAGLRSTLDAVEEQGIALATANLAAADLVLWLGAPDQCPRKDDVILVSAKADLGFDTPKPGGLAVSAVTGAGMNALTRTIADRAHSLLPQEGETTLNQRHRSLLRECVEHLQSAQFSRDDLVRAEEFRSARVALDRITGRGGVEDMLDQLFGSLCIGK